LATIRIDLDGEFVEITEDETEPRRYPFGSPEAFAVASRGWLRVGFDAKYVYGFTWLGRPILQLPEDLVRVQEVVYRTHPDVVIETGIAHGGSLIFYASLCKAMGHGRVIGVDIEIRPHNRTAIEAHDLFDFVELIEGDSVSGETLERVRSSIGPNDRALVMLDSKHTKDHVAAELRAYAPFVAIDSYIVAADGIMADVAASPLAGSDWSWNNPREAVTEFLGTTDDFVLDPPAPVFNEGRITDAVSYWAGGWLRRVK